MGIRLDLIFHICLKSFSFSISFSLAFYMIQILQKNIVLTSLSIFPSFTAVVLNEENEKFSMSQLHI